MRPEDDLAALERLWAERARRVAAVRARIVERGLTRPARDPDERAWLAERGEGALGPFVEVPRQAPTSDTAPDYATPADAAPTDPTNAERS